LHIFRKFESLEKNNKVISVSGVFPVKYFYKLTMRLFGTTRRADDYKIKLLMNKIIVLSIGLHKM